MMRRTPDGVVNVDELDAGHSMAFFNYTGNAWLAQRTGAGLTRHQDSAFVSVSGGFNAGRWQYRQQGHFSAGTGRAPHWHNLSSHLQRPLPGWRSQLTLGQAYTRGNFFSGLAYTGLRLGSDERMLADRQRGYAPVVRGIASSHARISIRQKGRMLYQTSVASGPFAIDDLPATSEQGDLEVTIEEADGSVRQFKVPFAALPESLRPGQWRYEFTLGRTRGYADNHTFADLGWRRGLSNRISLGLAARAAAGYQALGSDLVLATRFGAFGLNLRHSRAHSPEGDQPGRAGSGWMGGLDYHHTITRSDTQLGLASWRYSSARWRELGDLLASRRDGGMDGARPRTRLTVQVNQPMGRYGQLSLSASGHNWHQSARSERQWQAGYGMTFSSGLSMSLAFTRQYTTAPVRGAAPGQPPQAGAQGNAVYLSLAMPLGRRARSSISASVHHSADGGSQRDIDASGSVARVPGLSWHLGASRQQAQRQTVWNGSVQQRLATANLGLSASCGPQYWQAAGNIQGALVVHGGGVTLGPWLGETFALVEAKGARGARLGGGQGSRIDRHGYALEPALTPYRQNRVFLDPQEMSGTVELDDAEQRIAPLPGASVKLSFRTRRGQAFLIQVALPGGQRLPPGTRALDADGHVAGMLGQGNWLYLRSEHASGRLQLRWGEGAKERCWVGYASEAGNEVPEVRLRAECVVDVE